jgi:hypothetical protein
MYEYNIRENRILGTIFAQFFEKWAKPLPRQKMAKWQHQSSICKSNHF